MGKTNAALPTNTNANSVELTAAEVPTLDLLSFHLSMSKASIPT
uniref:Sodium/hydrogen exchanger 1-like isoform X2 n=1 Tax=Rhizophora mucronata TaxID=61149 RepID=A0A2P2LSG3_RHIMU